MKTNKTRIIKEKVENRIRKLKAGRSLWSPKYQLLVDSIELWRRINRWKKGCNTSQTAMKRLTKKLNLNWKQIKYCTEKTAEAKLIAAKRKYYLKKKYFAEWRKEFQYSYIDALAKSEHLPRKTTEERIKREEQQVINGVKAKNISSSIPYT